jgi:hypothetical protein
VRKARKGYFNNINAWKIEGADQAQPTPQPQVAQPVNQFNDNTESGELPF